jgi:hypothetical protein
MIEADGSQLGDARELQPLATATPEQAGMSGERLSRISTMLKKEIPALAIFHARRSRLSGRYIHRKLIRDRAPFPEPHRAVVAIDQGQPPR